MEVVTDKVTMEVPSPVDGTFLRVLVTEGETVPMGAPIAEMETAEAPAQDPQPPAPAQAAQAASRANVTRRAKDSGTTGYLVKDVRPVGPTGSFIGEGDGEGEGEETPSPETTGAAPGGAARPSPAVRRLPERTELTWPR